MKRTAEGFLFDLHEGPDAVVLWLYQDNGHWLRLEADFYPTVYALAERPHLCALGEALTRDGLIGSFRLTERIEFWSGKTREVGAYTVHHYEAHRRVVSRLEAAFGESALYNADLPIPQYYLYTHDLFPLGRVAVEYEDARVLEIHALSALWETDYRRPDLRILEMRCRESPFVPLEKGNGLILRDGRESYELASEHPRALVDAFNRVLRRIDPDVLLSEYGDEVIFPWLIRTAARARRPLLLDRDAIPTTRATDRAGKSYMSYGRIIYKPPSYLCFGRWHIDRANSFIVSQTGLDGFMELTRLARLPPQKMARTSPGTAMNSMECYEAFRQGVLIPYQKAEPEKYKTAWDLLVSDKGGLTYKQPIGVFENVAEIDYASLYPALMAQKNLSPETVRCACCTAGRVPDIDYNVCEQREGLLPRVLRPLLEQRRIYKQLKKQHQGAAREVYDRRQLALKWLLVTAFGFTGYRNARFGRIECHEATTAWGRELLLQAKEMAEARGYYLLHALTDSLWITKPALTEVEVQTLCQDITAATDVEMSLEGIYRWIVFLPSKAKDRRPVACRYFGRLQNPEIKARGLLSRRHDTPEFIATAQEAWLQPLSTAMTAAEAREQARAVESLLKAGLEDLALGRVAPVRLLIARRLSKAPARYKERTLTAEAVRQLLRAGVRLHPGQTIRYLVVAAHGVKPSTPNDGSVRVQAEAFLAHAALYDVAYYQKLLRAAAEEILSFFIP